MSIDDRIAKRKEFLKLLDVAIVLAEQLNTTVTKWGYQMEARRTNAREETEDLLERITKHS